MAMTLMQSLYDATGGRLAWHDIDLVVSQPDHFEALEYAVGQQWIEVSAVFDAVRLTAEGPPHSHSVTPGRSPPAVHKWHGARHKAPSAAKLNSLT